MIYNDAEFFNADRVIEKDGIPGVVLNRYSGKAVDGLDTGEDRRGAVTQAYGNEIEIRFVAEKDCVDIHLGAYDKDGYVSISNGDYHNSVAYLPQDRITRIRLERHPRLRLLGDVGPERFSREVWRITYLKRFTPVFAGIDGMGGSVRPPAPDEIPSKTMLAYGSSITFGAGTGPMSVLTHMQILAQKLGIQVMNKSMPGSCFCEFSLGDFLSGIPADYYFYELGGNMRLRYSPGVFAKRAEHLVSKTRERNPASPIILLTVYPLLKSIPDEDHEKASAVIVKYDETLYRLAKKYGNIHMVDSADILNDPRMLSFDGLHPSGYGNIEMAANLYEKLKNII
ncbi:MAG: SGNH/GDSL hydrolase family protein [Clostridia bacterium]